MFVFGTDFYSGHGKELMQPIGLPHYISGLTGHHVMSVMNFTREQVIQIQYFICTCTVCEPHNVWLYLKQCSQ